MNYQTKNTTDGKTGVIYTLSCPDTGLVRYVGQTVNANKRYRLHLWGSKKARTHKEKWINTLVNNGKKPLMDIVWEGDIIDIDKKEIQFIALFKSFGAKLTNATSGGKTTSGRKCSEETKKKFREMFTGVCLRPPITESEKKAASERMKSFKMSEDQKKKLREIRTGMPSYWSTHEMPQSLKDRIAETGRRASKKVISIKDGVESQFNSTVEAERVTGVDRKSIRQCANGSYSQSKGYSFQFL